MLWIASQLQSLFSFCYTMEKWSERRAKLNCARSRRVAPLTMWLLEGGFISHSSGTGWWAAQLDGDVWGRFVLLCTHAKCLQEPRGCGCSCCRPTLAHPCCRNAGGLVCRHYGGWWGEHRCLPSCGQQLDEISVAGTANGSCLSFFAYLRMLVVFLHSLEGRSESWWESPDFL